MLTEQKLCQLYWPSSAAYSRILASPLQALHFVLRESFWLLSNLYNAIAI